MFLMFFGNEDLGKRTFLFLVLLLRELSTYATMKHFNTFIPTGCGRQNENVFEPSLGVEVL